MPIFGHFCVFRHLPRGGFYINPSRRGPVTPFFRVLAGEAGKSPKMGILGDFAHFRGKWGFRGPGGTWRPGLPGRPQTGDRAPARGVDVKPPSRGSPGPGPGDRGPLTRVQTPSRGPGGLPGPLRAPSGAGNPSRGSGSEWFYINPSRRGPAPARAARGPGSRGPGETLSPGEGGTAAP